ncbi:3-ketoacyl-(acyl-carrier-protein) reductase [Bordetella ansorpii]|uniref:3-ketoacyl-(Acyl-carrier-protein) reductase n=1 Tax=Bordetella ansorpii TaxID=288768 RepID=A0A157SVJ1_9BORD|nr:SDR family oxidoreductase [Bordetella ansorpii]SAI74478.1 3-ketoacyl-(acyl-carrier-protein) reductase [Bordetella ansorpii]
MRLNHVSAIVTGAAGGIGRAVVRALLESGAKVLATDIDDARLQGLKDSLAPDHHARLRLMRADLGDAGSPPRLLDGAEQAFGQANAVVNSSGLGRAIYTRDLLTDPPPVWDIDFSAWHSMFDANTMSPIRLINAAVRRFRAGEWGRVITITTSLDHMLANGSGPYGPSKAALEAYTSILARELSGSGITANVLVPGGTVDTPMVPDIPNLSRESLLSPDVMIPPLQWLLSRDADGVTCRRIRANLWDTALPPEAAYQAASAPAGWWDLAAGQQRRPRMPAT